MYLWLPRPRALTVGMCELTWHRDSKLLRLDGEKPPTQLVVAAVSRTNQSYGAFTIGRLVIEGHLLIGQDFIVV